MVFHTGPSIADELYGWRPTLTPTGSDIDNRDIEKPVIKAGLEPIKWVNNTVTPTTVEDTSWYDYGTSSMKWANAQTKDGSMWTWIPRYAYRIIYYDNEANKLNKNPAGIIGYSDNRGMVDKDGKASTAFSRLIGDVEIVFLGTGANQFKYKNYNGTYIGDVTKTGANNPNHYVVHPAFSAVRRTGYTKKDGNYGNTAEIPGFWVSKFEMGPESVSKPNIASQRSMSISDMFTLGRNLAAKREISGGDSNAMTTTQWGAVAYLTKAIGKEPVINLSNTFTTGEGNYIANVAQSTTGNTTGIYDMNGCAWETMATYVNGGTLTDANGKNLKDNKETKYVDVYAAGGGNTAKENYDANADKYGDAQYEVSSNGASSPLGWSGDYSYFPCSTGHVFYRGGEYYAGGGAGVFAFGNSAGQPYSDYCWRRGFHFVTSVPFFPFI